MKKFLIVAALSAVAAINSYGAACASSGTLLDYALVGSCTVSVGSYSWTLSNFYTFDSTNTFDFNLLSAINLNIANNGTNAFTLTYTQAQGSSLFTVNGTTEYRNNVWITGSGINSVTNSATVGSLTGESLFDFTKQIQNQSSVSLGSIPLSFTSAGANSLSTSIPSTGALSINDFINWNGSGTVTSYSNTFAVVPDSGVPEPMTFVLMGAGLVGIAALRRRKA